jgi:hypothetical protein
MTVHAAGTPHDTASTDSSGLGTPSIDYADELAAEIVEIESHVTAETKQEAAASLRDEKMALENERLKIDLQMLKADLASKEAENKDREKTTQLRSDYAEKAYKLAKGSIFFWVAIIASEALTRLVLQSDKAVLSDAVLIAVTTGCTVNVLAAFLGVIRGLFPSSHHSAGSRGKKKKKGNKGKPQKKDE